MPTLPSPSPTTTSAVKLNRRPPLTTLATRLIVTTRSRYRVFSTWSRPPRPPSRPPRPRPSRPPLSPPGPLLPPLFGPDPEPRRCGPGIRCPLLPCWLRVATARLASSLLALPLELESGFARGVGQRGKTPR